MGIVLKFASTPAAPFAHRRSLVLQHTAHAVWSKLLLPVALLALVATASGCGAFRETMPPRSAAEQLILSAAVDRAVQSMRTDWMAGAVIYVDSGNLDCYDKPYVLQRIRHTILANAGRLVPEAAQADVVLEVSSGALSVDKGTFLIGFPEVPVPIPFAAQSITLPELPIFKLTSYIGTGKLLFCAVDAETGSQLFEMPTCYGRSHWRLWKVLLVGPFKSSDVPITAEQEAALSAKRNAAAERTSKAEAADN